MGSAVGGEALEHFIDNILVKIITDLVRVQTGNVLPAGIVPVGIAADVAERLNGAALENIAACHNGGSLGVDADVLHSGTAGESILSDFGDCIGNVYIAHCRAAGKSAFPYLLDGAAHANGLRSCASVKGAFVDFFDGTGNPDARQSGASVESIALDGIEFCGQINSLQTRTFIECIGSHTRDGRGNRDDAQTGALESI